MYRKVEKGRIIREKMKGGDGEFEMLLNEIPYATSMNHLQHHLLTNASLSPPVGSLSSSSMQSQYTPSSSFSGGFCSSDDKSPSPTPLEEYTAHQTPNAHYFNTLWMESKSPDSGFMKNPNDNMFDELGLSETLYRMNIRDEQRDCVDFRKFHRDPDGFGLGSHFYNPCIADKYYPSDGLSNGGFDFGGFRSSMHRVPTSFDDDMESALVGLQQGCKAGNPMGFSLSRNQSNALYSDPICYQNQRNHLLEQKKEQGSKFCYRQVQLQNPSMARPYLNDALFYSQQYGMDSNIDRSVLNPVNPSQLMCPKRALSVEKPLYNYSMSNERTRSISSSEVPQAFLSMKGTAKLGGFSCEDSFIIQEKNMKYAINKRCDRVKGQKKNSCNAVATRSVRNKSLEQDIQTQSGVICANGQSTFTYPDLPSLPFYSSLAEIQGCMHLIAKDQNGCRFLQRKFDEGTCQDVQIIFNGIIDHVAELMMNPFGNYLVQKLLDVCDEEQRMQIICLVTQEPGQLVKISLNTHGTRSVQKLIETLKTRQQISSVISALEQGFLDLIKDLNGNHVVQRCLEYLNDEHNKFIFDAATRFCVDIATHRHGCCVLQRCIEHSAGGHRDKLVIEIAANALLLSQDPFGNYVVQYIIEMGRPSVMAILTSQFEGNYVYLSTQKFSSHVVEKFMKFFEDSRSKIISELLSVSHFEQLLQDPFANYVIQSALEVTKGPLHALLVEAVRPHTFLRTSPYCKRIFSRNLLKK